jgi:hypothetical protein
MRSLCCERCHVALEGGLVALEGGDALSVEGGLVAQGSGLLGEVEVARGEEAELVPCCEEAFRGGKNIFLPSPPAVCIRLSHSGNHSLEGPFSGVPCRR